MSKKTSTFIFVVATACLLAGCGDDDSGDPTYEIEPGLLSGTINEEPFEAVDGRARRMGFLEPDQYGVEFFGTEPEGGDSCSARDREPHIGFILQEDEVGEFTLENRDFSWTTYEGETTRIGITNLGKLVIDANDGTLVGGASAEWQGPSTFGEVSGEFEVPICDE